MTMVRYTVTGNSEGLMAQDGVPQNLSSEAAQTFKTFQDLQKGQTEPGKSVQPQENSFFPRLLRIEDNDNRHYRGGQLQPLHLIESQDLNFHIGSVVKYAVRANFYTHTTKSHEYNDKAALKDIAKAIWYLERYRELIKNGLVNGA